MLLFQYKKKMEYAHFWDFGEWRGGGGSGHKKTLLGRI